MEDILVIILLVVMVTGGWCYSSGGWPDSRSTLIVQCVARDHRQNSKAPRAPRLKVSQFIRTKIQGFTGLGRLVMEIPKS